MVHHLNLPTSRTFHHAFILATFWLQLAAAACVLGRHVLVMLSLLWTEAGCLISFGLWFWIPPYASSLWESVLWKVSRATTVIPMYLALKGKCLD